MHHKSLEVLESKKSNSLSLMVPTLGSPVQGGFPRLEKRVPWISWPGGVTSSMRAPLAQRLTIP